MNLSRYVGTRQAQILITCTIIGTQLTSCGYTVNESERNNFARLYAELLIAETTFANDSTRKHQVIDSLLQGTEFANMKEVRDWLEKLTANDSEGLKIMMDSTQQYLERIRDNVEQPTLGREQAEHTDSLR